MGRWSLCERTVGGNHGLDVVDGGGVSRQSLGLGGQVAGFLSRAYGVNNVDGGLHGFGGSRS